MIEWQKQNRPPAFQHRSPMREAPFVPKKVETVVEQCPFNLHSDRRLQERKQFNTRTQRALLEKQKQVENVSKTHAMPHHCKAIEMHNEC